MSGPARYASPPCMAAEIDPAYADPPAVARPAAPEPPQDRPAAAAARAAPGAAEGGARARARPAAPGPGEGAVARLACALVQPILSRVVRRIAARHPSLFARLGAHQRTDFLIDPVELPFALHLRPDPKALVFRAVPRDAAPAAGATIRGRFLLLLELVDAEEDGDAAFFARDLDVSGDTEAVVRLRNALDDMDGSLAAETAAMFGPPGRAILARLRRAYPGDIEGKDGA